MTLAQPWATLVTRYGKDVENRTWPPPAELIGRRVAIHAGSRWDASGWNAALGMHGGQLPAHDPGAVPSQGCGRGSERRWPASASPVVPVERVACARWAVDGHASLVARGRVGRCPKRTSQLPPSRVSLHTGERPQVACPVCGAWRWLKRGMLRPHRADDGITRCPGSGQRVVVDETPRQWRTRMRKAAEALAAGSAHVTVRSKLDPVIGPNGRPRLATSTVDPRRVHLTEPDTYRMACPLCGRWRNLQALPGQLDETIVGAHRADDGITRCPGSGQRVVVDETAHQWRARLDHAHHEAARVAPAVAALHAGELDLEIELPDSPVPLRKELTSA